MTRKVFRMIVLIVLDRELVRSAEFQLVSALGARGNVEIEKGGRVPLLSDLFKYISRCLPFSAFRYSARGATLAPDVCTFSNWHSPVAWVQCAPRCIGFRSCPPAKNTYFVLRCSIGGEGVETSTWHFVHRGFAWKYHAEYNTARNLSDFSEFYCNLNVKICCHFSVFLEDA